MTTAGSAVLNAREKFELASDRRVRRLRNNNPPPPIFTNTALRTRIAKYSSASDHEENRDPTDNRSTKLLSRFEIRPSPFPGGSAVRTTPGFRDK